MDQDRAALAPQQAFADPLGADSGFRSPDGDVVEQYLGRLGQLLQPRGRRHAVAGQGDGTAARQIAHRGNHLARGDSYAQLERPVTPKPQASQSNLHLEGAQAGAQGVVVVGFRNPEDGQDRIADELLEGAAKADDGIAQNRQSAVDTRPNLLGIELVDQLCIPHEVRE